MSSSLQAQLIALERENTRLREQMQTQQSQGKTQTGLNLLIRNVQGKAFILPEDMVAKFNALRYAVDQFVVEMDNLLQKDTSHRDRVIRAMNTAGEAQAFRVALTQNSALQQLATQPFTNNSDVWRVCIWQFLVANIFSYEGTTSFYSSAGQNAAHYIRNIHEIDHLMRFENQAETVEGRRKQKLSRRKDRVVNFTTDKYARRLWRKQAIDAVFRPGNTYGRNDARFPKEDHPWLASTRQESINELVSQILQIFDVFLGDLPRRSDTVQELIAQAVHLNECFMHQAEFDWTIELDTTGESSDAFYNHLGNMNLAAVNTDSGRRENLDTATIGMRQEEIRSRLYNVCATSPALKCQEYSGSDQLRIQIGPVTTKVKSTVAVGWTTNRNSVKWPDNPSMFYIMAQSLRLVPFSR